MFARLPNGDWESPIRVVSNIAQVAAQKVADTLNLWLGEWFIDVTKGTDWPGLFRRRGNQVAALRALIRSVLSGTANIASIVYINITEDRARRSLAASFLATCTDGSTITGSGTAGAGFDVVGNP